MLAEDGADVDRRGGQRDPLLPAAGPLGLDPVDRFGDLLRVPIVEALGQAVEPGGGRGEVLPLFGRRDRLRLLADQPREPAQAFAQGVLDDLRLPHAAVAAALPGEPLAHVLEELAGAMEAVGRLVLGIVEAGAGEEALLRAVVIEPPQGELDLAAGEPQAQVIAGHRLQRVGLVEDHDVVLGQHALAVLPQSQVGEVQGVVDDEDLGVGHPPPGLVVEAGGVVRALAAHAVRRIAGHFLPHRRRRLVGEVGQGAVAGVPRPGLDLAELLVVFLFAEQARGAAQGVLHPPQAEVVVPSLDEHGGELGGHHAPQERQVLGQQLLLEADRVGGDDHAAAARFRLVARRLFAGGQDGGHEVGEALADAGAALDDEVMAVGDGVGHRVGHGQLFVAVFVVRQPRGDAAAGPEDFSGSKHAFSVAGGGGRGKRRDVRITVRSVNLPQLGGEPATLPIRRAWTGRRTLQTG